MITCQETEKIFTNKRGMSKISILFLPSKPSSSALRWHFPSSGTRTNTVKGASLFSPLENRNISPTHLLREINSIPALYEYGFPPLFYD